MNRRSDDMNHYELYKDTFHSLKKDVDVINESLLEMMRKINAGDLLSRASIEDFKDKLDAYMSHDELLHALESQFSFSPVTNLNEMPKAIHEYERKNDNAKIVDSIFEYLHLDSTEKDTLTILEETKKVLVDAYTEDEDMVETIKPYELVLEKTILPNRTLTRLEHSIISKKIEPGIAYAVEHNELFLNLEINISAYFEERQISKQIVGDDSAFVYLSETDTVSQNNKSTWVRSLSPTDKNKSISKFIPDYYNYISTSTIIRTKLTKERADLNEIQQLVKKYDAIPYLLWIIAREQLIKNDMFLDKPEFADTIGILIQKKYVIPLEICDADVCNTFYTISSKGWMCFTNSSIINYLFKQDRQFTIPKTVDLPVRMHDDLYIYRLSQITDYLYAMGERYVAWSMDETDFPLAIPLKCTSLLICSSALKEGIEETDMATLSKIVMALGDNKAMLIVVKAHSDINLLSHNLQLSVEELRRVYFVVCDKEYAIFDSTGVDVKSSNDTISAIDEVREYLIELICRIKRFGAEEQKTEMHIEKDYAIAVNEVKTDEPKPTRFKKELYEIAKTCKEIQFILPLFTKFGMLTIEQVYSFAMYMDEFSCSNKQNDFVSKTVEYLSKNGYLAKYQYSVDKNSQEIFCLSQYCCDCMMKDSIRKLKSFWKMPVGECVIRGEDKMDASILIDTFICNEFLLKYIMIAQRCLKKQQMKYIYNSIKWVDNNYQVMVFWDNTFVPCNLICSVTKEKNNNGNMNLLVDKCDIDYIDHENNMIFYLNGDQICLFEK